LVERLEEKRRFSHLAEAAVVKVISYLKNRKPTGFLGLNDSLLNNPVDFKDIDFDKDYVSFAYNFWDESKGDFSIFYGLVDEARKININKASYDVLKSLFMQLGLDELKADEVSSSIIDWRDQDSDLSSPNSAEDSYYRFLKNPYEAKDSDFEVLEELILIRGMDKDIFEKIKDYLTVYGDGKININTASSSVLVALGLEPHLARKIVSFRAGEDGILGTEDDNVFRNTEEIINRLGNILTEQEKNNLLKIVEQQVFCVDSNFFTLNCVVKSKQGKANLKVNVVLDRQGNVLFWKQH